MEIKTTQIQQQLKGLQRKNTNKIVVLVSGGIDSTAVCKKLKEEGFLVSGLWINYGQSASTAEEMCIKKQMQLGLIDELYKMGLDIPFWKIPESAENDIQGWVPGRNSLFMLFAGILAEVIDADGIAIGFMLQDCGVFGDNNLTHHKIVEALLAESLSREVKVYLPIANMTKKELIEYVKDIPTVSCWFPKILEGEIVPCMKCPNCKERAKYEIM